MAQLKVWAVLLLVAALSEVHGRSIESSLLGSKDSERKSHIYHLAIFRKRILASEEYVGSGALLSHRWLVTSARVAKKLDSWFYSSKVKAGLERLQSKEVQSVDVEKIVVHEFYKGKDADNDIALVKVKSPGFALNEYVGVVPIASSEPSGQVLVTGWHAAGKEKKPLQEVALDLKDRRDCGTALGDEQLVDETLFCVQNTAERAVCSGDHGSPANVVEGDRDVLVGIFSMTKDPGPTELCGTSPAIFTNIAYYASWIGNNIV